MPRVVLNEKSKSGHALNLFPMGNALCEVLAFVNACATSFSGRFHAFECGATMVPGQCAALEELERCFTYGGN